MKKAELTKERIVALRLLSHYIDNMSYWQESKDYYADSETDINAVDREVFQIQREIIRLYDLNSINALKSYR